MRRTVLLVLVCSACTTGASAQLPLEAVALTGWQVPGAPAGVVYGPNWPPWWISGMDDEGNAIFGNYVTGPGVTPENQWTSFLVRPGQAPALLYRTGEPSPVGGGTLTGFWTRIGGGQLLVGLSTAPEPSSDYAWYAGPIGGTLTEVVRRGDPAPGGSTFREIDGRGITSTGQAMFIGDLDQPSAPRGIFAGTAGNLERIIAEGDPAPGLPSGWTVGPLLGYRQTSEGDVVVRAEILSPTTPTVKRSAAWIWKAGHIELVATTGSPVPGGQPGTVIEHIDQIEANNGGQVIVIAALKRDEQFGYTVFSRRAALLWRNGAIEMIAGPGKPLPHLPPGFEVVEEWGPFNAQINDGGQILLLAPITGPGLPASARGVWSGHPEDLQLVTKSGDAAPGTGSPFTTITVASLNSMGQVLLGGVVNGPGTRGAWVSDRAWNLHLVARQGDPVGIAPGDVRTISTSLQTPGLGDLMFNDQGRIVLHLRFTDGSAGIFVTDAPPEPCYANCDGSTSEPILTVDDFTCFVNEFAVAQSLPFAQQVTHYANCDGSTSVPVLTVDDFTCFINAFAQGCP